MIEVLVAVAIIGLVATAAFKLGGLSTQALGYIRKKEAFLDRASEIQVGVMTGKQSGSGVRDDLSWNLEEKETPMMDEETFGHLDFNEKTTDKKDIKWRELILQEGEHRITLILPEQEK